MELSGITYHNTFAILIVSIIGAISLYWFCVGVKVDNICIGMGANWTAGYPLRAMMDCVGFWAFLDQNFQAGVGLLDCLRFLAK